jgi:hypothetical protein
VALLPNPRKAFKAVEMSSCRRGGFDIAHAKRPCERSPVRWSHRRANRHPEAPQILSLEAIATTPHLHAVAADEEVRDVTQQQPAEDFEVPPVGHHVVQVVVRVTDPLVEHRVGRSFEIGYHELRAGLQIGINSVDRPIPLCRPATRHVTSPEPVAVLAEVVAKSRMPFEIDKTGTIPRVDKEGT